MPFTPYHFGPGLLGKGLFSRWYSWTAFVASNVIIDLEPAYWMARGQSPIHRGLHTWLGAAVVGVVTAGVMVGAVLQSSQRHVRKSWAVGRPPTSARPRDRSPTSVPSWRGPNSCELEASSQRRGISNTWRGPL